MELSILENQNPTLYKKCTERDVSVADEDDDVVDAFDEREIFGKYPVVSLVSHFFREF